MTIPFSLIDILAILAYSSAVLSLLGIIYSESFKHRFLNYFSLPTPSGGDSYPVLDIFRGLAALWVAAFHTWSWGIVGPTVIERYFVAQGYKGLVFFCVLSGFLIYRSVKRKSIDRDSLKNYFRRRVLRIYPLYLVTTLIIILIFAAIMGIRNFPATSTEVLSELFLLRTFVGHCCLNPPAWSLTVEVLFYLILPLYFLLIRRRVAILSGITLLLLVIIDNSSFREIQLVKYFIIGMLASEALDYIKTRKSEQQKLIRQLAFVSGIVIFWIDIFLITDPFILLLSKFSDLLRLNLSLRTVSIATYSPSSGIAFALVMVSMINLNPGINVLLRGVFQFFRFIGVISYSIYLWHSILIMLSINKLFLGNRWLDIHLFQSDRPSELSILFIYFPAFIFASAISFIFLERPFLRRRS